MCYLLKILRGALLILACLPVTAQAAFCGKPGQRPCERDEHVLRCAPGLIYNFARRQCERPARPPPPAKPIVRDCGRFGQRPCLVEEHFPPCDRGLAEDPESGKCVVPPAEKLQAPE